MKNVLSCIVRRVIRLPSSKQTNEEEGEKNKQLFKEKRKKKKHKAVKKTFVLARIEMRTRREKKANDWPNDDGTGAGALVTSDQMHVFVNFIATCNLFVFGFVALSQ